MKFAPFAVECVDVRPQPATGPSASVGHRACFRSLSRLVSHIAVLTIALIAVPALASPVEDCEQSKDIDATIAACTAVITQAAQDPKNQDPKNLVTAYNQRGIAYEQKAQGATQAVADFSKAIEIAPTDARAYRNRALLSLELFNLDAAISDLDKAIRLDPSDATSYAWRGEAYDMKQELDRKNSARVTEDFNRAMADFAKALELDPNNAIVRRYRDGAARYVKQ